jgi:hypothetical protein
MSCSISLWNPFSSLDEDTKEDCLSSYHTLMQVCCGIFDPETMLDFMDQTMDKSTRTRFIESDAPKDDSLLTIAPTVAASYALQVIVSSSLFHILSLSSPADLGLDGAKFLRIVDHLMGSNSRARRDDSAGWLPLA